MSIFGDFREVANSAKIKPTRKIPDISFFENKAHMSPAVALIVIIKWEYHSSVTIGESRCAITKKKKYKTLHPVHF